MKLLFAPMLFAVGALCSCGSKSASDADASASAAANDSTLIVYYSQTGATKAVAEDIQSRLGCDIVAIEAVTPYDGDYNATIQRWRQEMDDSVKVEIEPLNVDLANYNTIFLGFPIWGGSYALPVATFLADNALDGKKVVTFATFGSGGIDSATSNVAAALPGANVVKGYGVRNARVAKSPAEIERFLIENGYIAGDIEPLPEYSATTEVSDEDAKIFTDACGSYKFPLGTPVGVASRTTSAGKDYKYDVQSKSPDGRESTLTIYVTVPNGGEPEFTEVVRH